MRVKSEECVPKAEAARADAELALAALREEHEAAKKRHEAELERARSEHSEAETVLEARAHNLAEQLSCAVAERDANKKVADALTQLGSAKIHSLHRALVTWPTDIPDECATAMVKSLFDVGGSFQAPMRQVCGFRLCSIDVVRNADLASSFMSHSLRMKNLRRGDPTLFHHECQCDEQKGVLHILKTLFHPVMPGAWFDRVAQGWSPMGRAEGVRLFSA